MKREEFDVIVKCLDGLTEKEPKSQSAHKAGEPFTKGCHFCSDTKYLPKEGLEYAGEYRVPDLGEWRVNDDDGLAILTGATFDRLFEILRPRKPEKQEKKKFEGGIGHGYNHLIPEGAYLVHTGIKRAVKYGDWFASFDTNCQVAIYASEKSSFAKQAEPPVVREILELVVPEKPVKITIIGTVGEGGKVTFFDKKKFEPKKTIFTINVIMTVAPKEE